MDEDVNPNAQDAFVILGGSIYGYTGGSAIGDGGTGRLYYVQDDEQAVSDATPAIDAIWDDVLVNIAASFYFEEKGDLNGAQAFLQRHNLLQSMMRSM